MVDDEQNKNEKIQGGLGRKHKRVDFFRQVKVATDEESSIDVFASNVSKGGMFVRSNQPLPAGQKVSLTFETDQGPVEVEEGEVRWSKEFEPISIDGTTPGMGIEFKKIAPESKNRIEAFIDEILQEEKPNSNNPVAGQTVSAAHTEKNPSPFAQLPDARPIVVTDIEPEPIRAPIRQAEPTPDSEITSAEAAFMSAGQANPGPVQSVSKEANPTPSRIQLQLSDSQDNILSAPPKPTTRLYLSVGFVLLVAASTFAIMMWLKPNMVSKKSTPNALNQGGKIDQSQPKASPDSPQVAVSRTESQPGQPSQAETNRSGANSTQSDQTKTTHKQPGQTQTLPSQPDRAQAQSAQQHQAPADNRETVKTKPAPATSLVSTQSQVASAEVTTKKANQTKTSQVDSNKHAKNKTPITLGHPQFRKTSNGWQMIVNAPKPLRIRYFTLSDPARLVIDVHQADYRGKQRLESPVPFIDKVRIGTKPDSTRLVLDFSGKKVPNYKVEQTNETIRVAFEK